MQALQRTLSYAQQALLYPDRVEDVQDAQAVLQLPLLLAPHGAQHHLAEVLHVHDAAEHDDQGLDPPKVLPAGKPTTPPESGRGE